MIKGIILAGLLAIAAIPSSAQTIHGGAIVFHQRMSPTMLMQLGGKGGVGGKGGFGGGVTVASSCSGPSLPATDSFAGSGPVDPGCWTQTTATGQVPLVRSSGFLVPNTASSQGLVLFTGTTFSSTQQYIQANLYWASGDYTGLAVNMTVGGTGVVYIPNLNQAAGFSAGTYGGSVGTCTSGPSASGDMVKVSNDTTNGLVVFDVTTSTTLCTGPYQSFSSDRFPGAWIDQRVSTTDKIANPTVD